MTTKTLYIMRGKYDDQSVVVCSDHAAEMPAVDGNTVRAEPADADCNCEFCPAEPMPDPLPKYTSVGSYPLFYLDNDENVLCASCADECDDVDWLSQAHPNYGDAALFCDECSERIESAYAEPTAYATDYPHIDFSDLDDVASAEDAESAKEHRVSAYEAIVESDQLPFSVPLELGDTAVNCESMAFDLGCTGWGVGAPLTDDQREYGAKKWLHAYRMTHRPKFLELGGNNA